MAEFDFEVLKNLTVPELQQELKKRGLKKNGVKSKLIQRLTEHIQKYGPDPSAVHIPVPVETQPHQFIERTVNEIQDPHPYMAEYEEQLVNDNNVIMDDYLNPLLLSQTIPSSIPPVSVSSLSGENQSADFSGQPQSNDSVLKLKITGISSMEPSIISTSDLLSTSHDPRDMAEELTEPIHQTQFNASQCNDDRIVEMSTEEVSLNNHTENTFNNPEESNLSFGLGENLQDVALPIDHEMEEENDENEPQPSSMIAQELKEKENFIDHLQQEDQTESAITDVLHGCSGEEVLDYTEIEEPYIAEEGGKNKTENNEEDEVEVNEISKLSEEDEGEIFDDGEERDVEEKTEDDSLDVLTPSDDKITVDATGEDFTEPPKQKQKIVTPVPLKKRVSLIGSSETSEERAAKRKRRWGSTSIKDSSVAISAQSLQKLIPDVKIDASALDNIPELDYQEDDFTEDQDEKKEEENEIEVINDSPLKRSGRTVKLDSAKKITLGKRHSKELVVIDSDSGEVPTPAKVRPARTLDLDDDIEEQEKREKSPSPARNATSCHLHIDNLVRPYTVNQLKALIGKTGTLVDDGFWINSIKSHCYVKLSSDEDATSTRQALHGLKWPSGSTKTLNVDFAVPEKMWEETEGKIGEKLKVVIEIDDKENMPDERAKHRSEEVRRDRGVGRRGRSERKVRKESTDKSKETSKKEEREESPAKLLDDLFRKTKATPCIYWLPLTEEQILQKEKKAAETKLDAPPPRDMGNDRVHERRPIDRQRSPVRWTHPGRSNPRGWR